MSLNSVFFLPVVQAYLISPIRILYAKIVPHSVEGLMTGLITSIVCFNSEVLMRLVGILYTVNLDISIYEYKNLWTVFCWSMV